MDIESVKAEISGASEAPLVLLEGYPKNQQELETFNQQVTTQTPNRTKIWNANRDDQR